MSRTYKVAVLIGSLRKDSINRRLAGALMALAPPSLSPAVVEIGEMPLYNPDVEADSPAAWTAFRDAVRPVDAVLFVTPEYNRSVPGGLKNAIDVGSRPYGQSVWNAKPAAVVSASPGAIGGFGANHHLRQSLVFLNMPAMPQPEAYIGNAGDLVDAGGEPTSDATRKFLRGFMLAFEGWVMANLKG